MNKTVVSPHVVIVGAGFAGLAAAREAVRRGFRVTVVDARDATEFQPLLYQVAVGVLPDWVLRHSTVRALGVSVRFVHGSLAGVNDAAREVLLRDGAVIAFDYLIIAVGGITNDFGVPGVREFAFGLSSVDDAVRLRERLSRVLTDCGRVLVVGGGPTGVEVAGAVADEMTACIKAACGAMRVTLLEDTDTLLPSFSRESREYAKSNLRAAGVDVRFGSKVTRVTPDSVQLSGGTVLHADLIVWTAGTRGNPALKEWGLPVNAVGRVLVDGGYRVVGLDRVYVVGDAAAGVAPFVAQGAKQSGVHAVRGIDARHSGGGAEAFVYRDVGQMVILDRGAGIVEVRLWGRLVRVVGWLGWFGWLLVHLVFLRGWRNRFAVLKAWLSDGFVRRRKSIIPR